jgi:hypothetical protein
MKVFRTVIFVTAAFLAGCAAPPPPPQKPTMMPGEYSNYAARMVGINKCVAAKQMSVEHGSLGLQYTNAELSRYDYESARLDSELSAYSAKSPSDSWCSQIAMNIMTRKRQINKSNAANNAAFEASKKEWDDIATRNQTRQVDCHQVGFQTVCSSR